MSHSLTPHFIAASHISLYILSLSLLPLGRHLPLPPTFSYSYTISSSPAPTNPKDGGDAAAAHCDSISSNDAPSSLNNDALRRRRRKAVSSTKSLLGGLSSMWGGRRSGSSGGSSSGGDEGKGVKVRRNCRERLISDKSIVRVLNCETHIDLYFVSQILGASNML